MLEFLLACILMGIGISIDVFIATMSQFRHFESTAKGRQWTTRIVITHTLFPMLGYYVVAFAVRILPSISIALGLAAAGLVFKLLWDAYHEWFEEGDEDLSGDTVPWTLVLAVSWDALLSGPAKASQAQNWTETEIAVSFLIAGAVVAVVAALALLIARRARALWLGGHLSFSEMASRHVVAFGLEFAVLGYFAVLAIDRLVFGWNHPPLFLFAAWAAVVFLLFASRFKSLKGARLSELQAG